MQTDQRYEGQVAIITGASSGIGHAAARAFAKRGCIVVAVARREALLEQLSEVTRVDSPRSIHLAGDLGEPGFCEEIIERTISAFGRVDILVNNAAISKHKHIYHTSALEAEHVMNVNFLSAVRTTLAAIPAMLVQGGGSIVNVSSFAAKVTPPREAIYAASKAAMNAFTEGLWNDLAGSNIHAAIVNPGPIDTEIWGKTDEPAAYDGPRYPPEIVVDAIFEVIEKRRHEVTVPKRNASLISAQIVKAVSPATLRAGMARMEPVPSSLVENARNRARARGGARSSSVENGSS